MDPALAQVAREHEQSPLWRSEIDRLRQLAHGEDRGGYRNSTGRLDRRSWVELNDLAEEGRLPPEDRKGAHKDSVPPSDEGLRHIHNYLEGCRKCARKLGDVAVAHRVHELVRRTSGYLVDLRGYVADRPYPEHHPASALAAHIHRRVDFGAGTSANRMAAVRNLPRPVPDEEFDLYVKPKPPPPDEPE